LTGCKQFRFYVIRNDCILLTCVSFRRLFRVCDDHVHYIGDDDSHRSQFPSSFTGDVRDARLGQSIFSIARPHSSINASRDIPPSVARWCCVKTAKDIVEILASPHSPILLVFCDQISVHNNTGSPLTEASNRGKLWKLHDFQPLTRYSSETVRYRVM